MSNASVIPRIGRATEKEWSEITELLDAVDLPREDLSSNRASDFLILSGDGRIQGVVGLESAGKDALLRSLAVHPDVRGKGYGSALVTAIEAKAREEGYRALYLLTTTAATFFEGLGYRQIERSDVPPPISNTEEFRRLCPNTATCMQKSLIS